jgi:hypothetical protein
MANKGVAGGGFWICGKYRGYGRNLGSVARKELNGERGGREELEQRTNTEGTEKNGRR